MRRELMLSAAFYFDLNRPDVAALVGRFDPVWDVLAELATLTSDSIGKLRISKGALHPGAYLDDGPVFIGEGAVIEAGAYVRGPAYIGPGSVVRNGAYVREYCVLLEGAVLGHASEAKNSVLL